MIAQMDHWDVEDKSEELQPFIEFEPRIQARSNLAASMGKWIAD